jgi:hypothetical protein
MFRGKFTDSEWNTVMFTPLWAFHTVAGVDSKVDSNEAGALAKELSEASLYRDEFTREVLSSIGASLPVVMQAYMVDSRGSVDGLQDAANLLDAKLPSGGGDAFKMAILNICIQAAKASGPRLFGPKVSKQEKVAIAVVAMSLRVPLPA